MNQKWSETKIVFSILYHVPYQENALAIVDKKNIGSTHFQKKNKSIK